MQQVYTITGSFNWINFMPVGAIIAFFNNKGGWCLFQYKFARTG